ELDLAHAEVALDRVDALILEAQPPASAKRPLEPCPGEPFLAAERRVLAARGAPLVLPIGKEHTASQKDFPAGAERQNPEHGDRGPAHVDTGRMSDREVRRTERTGYFEGLRDVRAREIHVGELGGDVSVDTVTEHCAPAHPIVVA